MKPTIPVQQVKKAPTPVVVAQKAAIPPSQPKPALADTEWEFYEGMEPHEMDINIAKFILFKVKSCSERGGWMCAWCYVDCCYMYGGVGHFEVTLQNSLECCDALDKAIEMCNQDIDNGGGYFKKAHWQCGEIDVYKNEGDSISMIVNKRRVLCCVDKDQAKAIVKATRAASAKADKEYEKEMATW